MEKIKIRCRGVVMHNGALLVVKHARATYYSLPGGHLDFGEDPETCLRRELLEELGVHANIGRLLYVHTLVQGDEKQYIEFFFEVLNSADFVSHHDKEKTHAYEIAEVVWADTNTSLEILPNVFNTEFKAGKLFETQTRFLHS